MSTSEELRRLQVHIDTLRTVVHLAGHSLVRIAEDCGSQPHTLPSVNVAILQESIDWLERLEAGMSAAMDD